jgi:hypothetical protein
MAWGVAWAARMGWSLPAGWQLTETRAKAAPLGQGGRSRGGPTIARGSARCGSSAQRQGEAAAEELDGASRE